MKRILLWLRICRPQTLFASVCPVVAGLLLAGHLLYVPKWLDGIVYMAYELDAVVASLTLVCALSLQILSNLINDYYDFIRGTDKAGRKGFKRALAEGEVSLRQMKVAIGICLLSAVLSGFPLVLQGGLPILLIGLSAIVFAWLYTATSRSLSYLGIADIFVWLYYGVIAVCGTVWLQIWPVSFPLFDSGIGYLQWWNSLMDWQLMGKQLPLLYSPFLIGSTCGLISMCVLIINNLRDVEEDRQSGKRTFPVRFGKRAGEWGMLLVILLAPLSTFLAMPPYDRFPVVIIVPLLLLFCAVVRAQGRQYNKCLMAAGLCNLIYVLLLTVTFFID